MPQALDNIDSTRGIRVADRPIVMDRYQIEGLLGQGGMGKVYKAYHTKLKREVAIKTVRVDFQQDPGVADRFLREMETIGQVDHPNVVRATDAGECNGILMLVMECLSGSDLSKIAAAHGPLKPADACELIRQSAEGLEHIHRSMIHRDIKPSNLMLTDSGVVKILDLGLARFQNALIDASKITPSGCIVGTFDYLAPEQAQGDGDVDHRADIYSLGCTLFRLLTGQAPFAGKKYDSPPKKMMAHRQIPVQDAEGFATIPQELQAIIFRMTAKHPDDRYASASEVAKALAPLCIGNDVTALLDFNRKLSSVAELTPDNLEELKRLGGQSLIETSRIPTEVLKSATVTVSRRFAWLMGAGVSLIAGLLLIIVISVIPWKGTPTTSAAKVEITGPRDLDGLEKDQWHNLMTHQPYSHTDIPIGLPRWQWDPKQPLINVVSDDLHILSLGNTRNQRVKLEVRFEQVPWNGGIGLFWGYTENPVARKSKVPQQVFATMQYLLIDMEPNIDGKVTPVIVRMQGRLMYNNAGTILLEKTEYHGHDLKFIASGTNVFAIEIDGDRLVGASLSAVPLTTLLVKEPPPSAPWTPISRGLGIVADGHLTTVDSAQLKLLSGN